MFVIMQLPDRFLGITQARTMLQTFAQGKNQR